MGLKYYLNLFKKDTNNEAVKLRYFFNMLMYLAYMVLAMAFFSLRDGNIIVSSVFGLLAFAALITQRILDVSFNRLLDRLIKNEPLGCDNEIDAAFTAYRKGYAEFNQKNKRLNKKLLPVNAVLMAALISFFPTLIVLDLMGQSALADKINQIVTYVLLGYFAIMIIWGFFDARKGFWHQSCINELIIINNYKTANGYEPKYKILEDKKPDLQLDYILPNPKLRKNHKISMTVIKITTIIWLVIFIATLVLIVSMASGTKIGENITNLIYVICFGINTAVWLVITVVAGIVQVIIIKKQRTMLEQNPDNLNDLYLRLHQLRTPFLRRWSILFVVCPIAEILLCVILGSIVQHIFKAGGGYFVLVFIISFIALFVIYFKGFGKVRQKMIVIEKQIDHINGLG